MDCDIKDWMNREPFVVYDSTHKREWLSPTPLIHYLHQGKEGWVVIDRTVDLACTRPHKTRYGATKAFYKEHGRELKHFRMEEPYNKPNKKKLWH